MSSNEALRKMEAGKETDPDENPDFCVSSSSRKSGKFGDDDLGSKKRKIFTLGSEDFDEDYKSFSSGRRSTQCGNLNSTYNEQSDRPSNSKSKNTNRAFISNTPSSSSYGFENTLNVLVNQVKDKNAVSMSPHSIRKFIMRNEMCKTPQFVNVPYKEENDDDEMSVVGDERRPSVLELELEASSRLKDLSLDNSKPLDLNDLSTINCPLNELLSEFVAKNQKQEDDSNLRQDSSSEAQQIVEESGEYPEYLYHVSKGKDGRLYLRVVRSLLIDKGKNCFNYLIEVGLFIVCISVRHSQRCCLTEKSIFRYLFCLILFIH